MKINEIDNLKSGEKKEFIPSDSEISQSYTKFLSDCSESLVEIKKAKQFLYRGVVKPTSDIFVGARRINRAAMGTDPDIQELLDNYLWENNFTALRSDSIFCVGNSQTASEYSISYLIFPTNGFSLTWNIKIDDFTLWLDDEGISAWDFEDYLENNPSFIHGFRNTNLSAAIRSNHEILISGSYYAFNAVKYESYLAKALL